MDDERWECKHHHHGCACREHAWEERVAGLEAEVARLKGKTYCAYCGERFPLDAPDATVKIGAHIGTCPQHPMRAVEAQRDALVRQIKVAVNEWCSCGGRGPDDADACSACKVFHMVFPADATE